MPREGRAEARVAGFPRRVLRAQESSVTVEAGSANTGR